MNFLKITILPLFLLVFTNYSKATEKLTLEQTGKEIYTANCLRCHGKNGDKGFPMAKKLTKNKLSDEKTIHCIEKGKMYMPSFKDKLTTKEIKLVADFIKGFKK